MHGLRDRFGLRRGGCTSALFDTDALAAFPRSVVPDARRKRTYWNALLARAEVDSSYTPARRPWRRERRGHCMRSPSLRVRVTKRDQERFVALVELLRLPLVAELAGR